MGVLAVLLAPFVNLNRVNPEQAFCANSISCIKNLTGAFEEGATEGTFQNKIVSVPQYLARLDGDTMVLGDTTVKKQIYVDLSTQHLYAFEDNKQVFDFPVSTGKWGSTPTGSFNIWIKLRYTRMSGGDSAIGTYYNLPNVPYTMFYYNKDVPKSMGYSIHGAYWHNNFGHPMSHGCVNMKIEEVAQLYSWANPPSTSFITYASPESPGTNVIVYGEPPKE